MPIVPKDVLETIRMHNDIADVVGSYLQLKRIGSTLKALCPFHKEKTPSFHVNPQRQIYHCFGCGAGGDVFKFVMEHERVDFMTAVRMLAEKAGIPLQYTAEERQEVNKDLLYKIHEEAALFYHRCLNTMEEAQPARDYLASRELDDECRKDFLIGYAPPGNPLLKLAKTKGYTFEQMEACGLLMKSDDPARPGHYDRFRHRLMFPIRNESGRIIAFSGRILVKDDKAAKYVNSPETVLFRKGRMLFALDRARKAIIDAHTAILCEGQIDCIRCHRAGFTGVVASQGTAITEEHARLLKRYADAVILVLDSDNAGQKAAVAAAEIFLAAGLSLQVAALPKGEDPDTLIRRQGPEAFQKVLDQAQGIVDFQINVLQTREDLRKEDGLMRVTNAVLKTIACAASEVQQQHLLQQAASRLSMPADRLQRHLRPLLRGPVSRATDEAAAPPEKPAAHPHEEVTLAELLSDHPETAPLIRQHLPLNLLNDPTCQCIIRHLLNRPEEDPQWNLIALLGDETDECRRLAAKIQLPQRKLMGEDNSPEAAVQQLIKLLWRKHLEQQRREIRLKMQSAEGEAKELLDLQCKQMTLDIKTLQHGWEKACHICEVEEPA